MARKHRFSDEPFGPTIQRLMAEQNITYRSLADKTGLSAGYLNHLVHGNRPVPSDDVIQRLAKAMPAPRSVAVAAFVSPIQRRSSSTPLTVSPVASCVPRRWRADRRARVA